MLRANACYLCMQEFVIPEEEAEWVGLSLEEAVEKQRLLEKKVCFHPLCLWPNPSKVLSLEHPPMTLKAV